MEKLKQQEREKERSKQFCPHTKIRSNWAILKKSLSDNRMSAKLNARGSGMKERKGGDRSK